MIKLSHELSKEKYSADSIISHNRPDNEVKVTINDEVKTYKGKKSRKRKNNTQKIHGYGDISTAYNAKRSQQADARKDQLKEAIDSGEITTVDEAKEFLNVSASTVHRYLKDLKMKLKSH